MSFWKIIKNHFRSSRFTIIVLVILLSFVAGVVSTIFEKFPFVAFAGILNALGVASYITKTLEPGAMLRRSKLNNTEKEVIDED